MGSRSSKPKNGSKSLKPKTEQKARKQKNNSHISDSTQSLNIDPLYDVVFSSQNPGASHASAEALQSQVRRGSPPPNRPPRSRPLNHKDHMQTETQLHLFENPPDGFKPVVPPRGKPPSVPNRPKLRADWNYKAIHESDISFRKGDFLQLLTDGEARGWLFVKNLTTGEEGYVRKDFVSMVTSHDVESQKCFFAGLDREEAEERLSAGREGTEETGTFLLWLGADGYELSIWVNCYDYDIKHHKVRVDVDGICYIEVDSNRKTFSNITELIRYYSAKPGLGCTLETPLPQDIPLNDLAVKFSDLKLGEELGSGNFGSVRAGTLSNNEQVAVKSLKAGGSMTLEEFRNEAETMHILHHKNLISLLAICEDRGTIYIITEMMSQGSLLNLLRKDSDRTFKFKNLMSMAIQVLEGMCYLERKGFVHRDLRAANVLVGDRGITKIADFGLARLLDSYYKHEDFYQDKKGSVFPYKWTAPEAIKKQKFTVKSDVWSFGILLYEMVTYGDEPYAAMSNRDVLEWVEKGNRLKKPMNQHCPATLYILMKQCWMINPSERPNFADIRQALVEIKAH